MTISAKQVMDLRAATGMPMMQCKRALESEDGDFEKAFDRLKKEGMKALEKRADKEAKEGLVRVRLTPAAGRATLLAVACETEPVARTEGFVKFVDTLVEHVDEKAPEDVAQLLTQPWIADGGLKVEDALTGLVGQLREKIEIVSFARVEAPSGGIVGGYQHHDQKNGAIVALVGEKGGDGLEAFAKQLCMHIVFSRPTALTRDQVPAEAREREERLLREQLAEDPKMQGKPDNVVQKILDGKMAAFYKQSVLTEQEWALPDSDLTVGELLKQHGAKVQSFYRAQVG